MKRLSQLSAFLIIALLVTSCSGGYYSHLPRAKKVTAKNEVVEQKTTDKTNTEVEEVLTAETIEEAIDVTITSESIAVVEQEIDATDEVEETGTEVESTSRIINHSNKAFGMAKSLFLAPIKQVKQLVKPTKADKTMNVSNTTALLLIVIGLVLGVLDDGALASIGSILVLIGVILLILNIFGVEY